MSGSLSTVSRKDKLALVAEWMDPHASLLRKFYLFFYPFDSTVELYDVKKNHLFLKRIKVQNVDISDIYVGNVVSIFSRQLKLVAYANAMTKTLLSIQMMKTFALIKPDGMDKMATIFQMLISNGFRIANLRMLKFTLTAADKFLNLEGSSATNLDLLGHLQTGPSIALELVGDEAIGNLMKLAGPRDPLVAKKEAPGSICAIMGSDEVRNAFYSSSSPELAAKELKLMFEDPVILRDVRMHTVVLQNSTCCVIKPHAVKEGIFGDIVAKIEKEGFKITAMQMFYLDNGNAEEFLEIYKGVLVEFNEMVQELVSGGCIAMEITGSHGKDTPLVFRAFTGPTDPEIARKLRPHTLRAMFGENSIKNAIHSSDLPADGVLEAEYFFKVLA